jgi:predicted MFS family arabinose efflux permease
MSVRVDAIQSSVVRESLLRVLSAASFLVFFQSYLVAPLVPALATEFHAPLAHLALIVPAYMLPHGFSTLSTTDLGQDRAQAGHPQFVGDHGAHYGWPRDSS